MAVKIGHASGDERGKISGGKAGDQTGREVYTRNWYRHSKDWYTIIPTDPEMLEYIAEAMEKACANNKIGYDQHQNRTLWNDVKDKGYNPAKTSAAVETDCAELAALCAQYALEKTGKKVTVADSYSANLASNLVKTGFFKKITADKYTNRDDYLLRGMIQTTRTKGHVWVILSNGKKASLKEFYGNVTVPEKEYALGERILRNGDEGKDVEEMQSYLIQIGYSCGSYGADGDFGDATELALRKFQQSHNCAVDGEFGPESFAALNAALKDIGVAEATLVRIVGGQCYVRPEPNTNNVPLGVVTEYTCLDYLGETSETGWLAVKYKGGKGWVSGKYGLLEKG